MSARDNLAAGKYENMVPLGIEVVRIDEDRMTVRQAREIEADQKRRVREQRQKHRAEEIRLRVLLSKDLELEHGLTGHPKADKVWDMAWERGHSSGYESVIQEYEELVELIR